MKPKRSRHDVSSNDSELSELSVESISSSDSDSEVSSCLDGRQKKKKKRKRAHSSHSDSDTDGNRKSKKRKHKKKKKRHSKKKRRNESDEDSDSQEVSSGSDDDSHRRKKKHKNKHKHRKSQSSSESDKEYPVEYEGRRLQSVVKERRASSEDGAHPTRTYYQKEYRRSPSAEVYDEDGEREREVQRFYRGSSKDRAQSSYQQQYHYYQNKRHEGQPQDKSRERYQQQGYNGSSQDNNNARKPREYVDYNTRNEQYGERRQGVEGGEYQRKPRVEEGWKKVYPGQGKTRGYPPLMNSESRPSRRPDGPSRDYQPRREHPQQHSYDKREHYPSQQPPDRSRDMHKERQDKLPPREQRERSRSQSLQQTNRELMTKRYEDKKPRDENQYRDYRTGEGFREKRYEKPFDKERSYKPRTDREPYQVERPNVPTEDHRSKSRNVSYDRSSNNDPRSSSKGQEKKSRFTDGADKDYSWGKTEVKQEGKDPGEKEQPNFGLSGKLTADTNTVNGIVIKYSEPDDAKQPKRRWRFYPFKGDKALSILYIHRQSCFLLGRERKVVDIQLEHPSVSKQHAALQYRATPFERTDGSQGRRVRPYIIDLESANGTFVNNKKIEPRRYVELMERDVVKFGFSQREYVLLHENSKDDDQDDDNQEIEIGANVTTTAQIKRDKRVQLETVEDGE